MQLLKSPGKARIIFSTAILSVVLILAVDLWLSIFHPLAKSPVPNLDRTEIFSAAKIYDADAMTPKVVLLGSSLVTAPLLQAEANYHAMPIPRFMHRRSHVMEEMLTTKLGASPQVFVMAVGGEMASDAFVITKHLLKQGNAPVAIVYGVAPRDFHDNLMPGIQSSETFRILAGVDDVWSLLSKSPMVFDQQAEVFLSRVSALFRYRTDIRTDICLRGKKFIEKMLPFVAFEKTGPDMQVRPRRDGWFQEEAKGTPNALPGFAVEHTPEKETRLEYMRRYNPVSVTAMDKQFGYLEMLFQLCDQHAVPVIVVNMPLSSTNKSLMAKGFYENYLGRVEHACKLHSVEFFDFNTTAWDEPSNYVDGVHLKPEMSKQFLSALSDVLARSQAALAIKSPKAIATSSGMH